MRRIAQFVALMVASLLAGQSATAEATCSSWLRSGGDQAAPCCASASATSSRQAEGDCHEAMLGLSITADCSQGGCQTATLRPAAPVFNPVRSKSAGAATQAVVAKIPAPLTTA